LPGRRANEFCPGQRNDAPQNVWFAAERIDGGADHGVGGRAAEGITGGRRDVCQAAVWKVLPWQWERDAHGRTCAYVGADATGIRQQGQHGAKADGRMAYVGMVFNPRGASWAQERRRESQPHFVRYLQTVPFFR
jgi:hypothetical protein